MRTHNKNRHAVSSVTVFTIIATCAFLLLGLNPAAWADTSVGGLISTDTTWTAAGSPYIVKSNVLIRPGATLTIESGVKIQFQAKRNLSIVVQGQINARGTASLPIYFESPDNTPGDWNGIIFESGSKGAVYDFSGNYQSGSIFEYCVIRHAGGGDKPGAIECKANAVPYINQCEIKNNKTRGIYFALSSTIHTIKVENSTFSENTGGAEIRGSITVTLSNNTFNTNSATAGSDGGGAYISGGTTVTLSNNTFSNNRGIRGGGADIRGSTTVTLSNNTFNNNRGGDSGGANIFRSTTVTLSNNTFSSNSSSSAGTFVGGGGGADISESTTVALSKNTFSNNSGIRGGGVHIYDGTVTLSNNTFSSNSSSSAGTFVSGGGGAYIFGTTVTMRGDIFKLNKAIRSAGVYIEAASGKVTYCSFEGNETSGRDSGNIILKYREGSKNPVMQITKCNIMDSMGYEIYNHNSVDTPDVDATNNWWNTIDRATIMDKIYDFFDDPTRGIVLFEPFFTSTVNLTLISTISLSPTSLSFSATKGGSTAPQTVSITNTGGGTLSWTASVFPATIPWLSISPTSGTAPSSITVSANTSGMSAGTHNATITITATDATNTPQNIPVTLTITEPPPLISLSPASLSFSATQGGSNPPAKTVSITNTGGGTLSWTASTNAPWLSISPTSGTAPSSITVSANISGTSVGTHNATITITAAEATNSPQTIPVALVITQPTTTTTSTTSTTTTTTTTIPPTTTTVPGVPDVIEVVPQPALAIAPNIVQAGYNFTRLILSAASGGEATLGATIIGGEGDLKVEAFITTTGVFGEPIVQSIGILKKVRESFYEFKLTGIPPGAVPVGEIPLPGISIEARDAKGRRDKWPIVVIGGEGTGVSSELIKAPIISLAKAQSPVPIIFQAGFGLSHLLLSPALGGTFTLQATVFGGTGALNVQAFFERVDAFGKKILSILGNLKDEDGNGVYELKITILPGVLKIGEIPIPGLKVTATDRLGQTDAWPNLVIWR